jgi:pantothenate kinase
VLATALHFRIAIDQPTTALALALAMHKMISIPALLALLTTTTTALQIDASMLPTYQSLATHLLGVRASKASSEAAPHWVCIAGGPGSGKSTLAAAVADLVNAEAGSNICVVLPMDGFHYSRAELKRLDPPDASEYMPRRGSPWTFDAEGCYAAFSTAKRDGEATLPTYSREISDPVPGGVRLEPSHEIVLCEGNYLLGASGEEARWAPLAELWDEKWFIKCADPAAQRKRLILRHLQSDWDEEKTRRWGPGEEGAAKRADSNDVLNMELIAPSEELADRVIESL